ncbi:tryptophan 2,3-dioxygenase family protein [Streptomyces sp. NBC_01267]|uniref:tryptophan 2,3-dioxygenase family protein n=1 Tax=Streptomyces sp. NBC_01267 TaxID=2903805 RepID=UPI002E325467|nr:tryptophan 2,3-dioxygenase family protein [Streptomyces sp. NBC_01267]
MHGTPTEPTGPSLPGDAENIARLQSTRGRAALTESERDRLAGSYEAVAVDSHATEAETIRLLTRPFSRSERIPEYYRYTSLHVYDWFLAPYGEDPVAAVTLAMRATLADLAAWEQAREDVRPGALPYLPERLARLHAVIGQVDDVVINPVGPVHGADVAHGAGTDAALRWRLYVLTRCTAFTQSDDDNEHIFLRSVHACELAFYLSRWTACRAIVAMDSGDREEAQFRIGQVAACSELIKGIFHALRTLSPEQFMNFREATGAASAVQSLNFHLMELALFGYDPRKSEVFERIDHLRMLNDPPYRAHWSLRGAVLASDSPELSAAFATVERSLMTWRGRHYGFGRLYLPRQLKGSGGTEGAGYLKRFVDKDSCLPGTPGPLNEAMFRFALR